MCSNCYNILEFDVKLIFWDDLHVLDVNDRAVLEVRNCLLTSSMCHPNRARQLANNILLS